MAPVPVTKPSLLNSRAGDTIALEKPVMGTKVPAPARLAMVSNTPRPVSSEARKIRVMDVQVPASSLPAPRLWYSAVSPSPPAQ